MAPTRAGRIVVHYGSPNAKSRNEPGWLSIGNGRIHYAWVIVAVAAAMRLISSSVRMASSVFVPHLAETFGWSYGAIGFGFSLQWIFSGLFGPTAGWLGDRYGVRRTMMLGAALFLAAMMLTGTMSRLWQFYLYFGVLLSASMAIFGVPLLVGVTMWFKKHLGVGIGTLQASQGLGPVITVPLVIVLLNEMGLKWAFWIPGIAGAVILLLLIRLFHNDPGEMGFKPLGASEDEPVQRLPQGGASARVRTRVFLHEAQRTGAFWNLIGIHFWGCAGHSIILIFLVAIAMDQGLSQGMAAALLVVLYVMSTITRFAVPVLSDRMGSKGVMAACFFFQAFPVIILFFAHNPWVFFLFAIVFGVGFGGEMSAFPIINRQYYGTAPVGTAYGWQMLGAGLGMAAGAGAGGFIWDLTGSYTGAIALSLGLSLVGAVSILVLPTTSHHLIPHWEESLPPEARTAEPPL